MKSLILALIATICLAVPAHAQLSAGAYAGATSPTPSTPTLMLMADYGTTVDIEPWIQSYGKSVQVGADVIVTAVKGVGVTVGAYSNTSTQRYGVSYTLGSGQVRLLRTVSGSWQGVAYYNFNLTAKSYIQLWAAPAQGGSSWLIGFGHTFKDGPAVVVHAPAAPPE